MGQIHCRCSYLLGWNLDHPQWVANSHLRTLKVDLATWFSQNPHWTVWKKKRLWTVFRLYMADHPCNPDNYKTTIKMVDFKKSTIWWRNCFEEKKFNNFFVDELLNWNKFLKENFFNAPNWSSTWNQFI